MGYPLHIVDQLPPPFSRVNEQIGLIPEGGHIPVFDVLRKVIFVLGGEFRHEITQKGRVREDIIRPGDIYIVPPSCPQRYFSLDRKSAGRFHAVRLAFDPNDCADLSVLGADPDSREVFNRGLGDFTLLPGGQTDPIRWTLAELRGEARWRKPGYRARVWSLCLSLSLLTCRQLAERERVTVPQQLAPREYHVGAIKDYIHRHQAQPLELERIAEHLQLSREHISRLFRQETGVTIFDYLRACRVETAKTLLASTEKNLSEIAQQTGFSSLTLFSRTFRRSVGITASEYRRQSAGQI